MERTSTSEPGCYAVEWYGEGMKNDGQASIAVKPGPGPVVSASLSWDGTNDITPDDIDTTGNRADSTLIVNGVEVVGVQPAGDAGVAERPSPDWYAWGADIGPDALGILTDETTVLEISGWDSDPNARRSARNGVTLTVVYDTSPCMSPSIVEEYEGIDYIYHGFNDATTDTVFIPVQNTPEPTELRLPFGLAGSQVDYVGCRGIALWYLAGTGSEPAYGSIDLVDTSGSTGVGINGGVEIVNDPFSHPAGTCEAKLNQGPPAVTYEAGHPYPSGAADAPYRAIAIEPPAGSSPKADLDLIVVDVIIPANSDWVAFQFESEKEQGGESGAWVANQTILKPAVGFLGDTVWFDQNRNCAQDPGEVGVAGAGVELFDGQGNSLLDAVTNDDGKYLFDSLLPGDFRLEFTAPNGYEFTGNDCDVDDVRDSDADPDTGSTEIFDLIGSSGDLSRDAGLVRPADVELVKSVGLSADGPFGDSVELEVGSLAWFSIDLEAKAVADDGLPLGDALGVVVEDRLPAGLDVISATTSQGTYDTETDVWTVGDVVAGTSANLMLEVRVNSAGPIHRNIAEVTEMDVPDLDSTPGNDEVTPPEDDLDDAVITTPTGPTMTIGDYVWIDADADGCQGGAEIGLAGVEVRLLSDGRVVTTAQTDADGKYLFTDLPVGDYTVEFVTPSGYEPTANLGCSGDTAADSNPSSTDVTGGADEVILDIDHGLVPLGSLNGRVWLDTDGDGCQASPATEPGIEGITVELLADGDVVATTTTDANGDYSFTDLPAGDYIVDFDTDAALASQPQGATLSPINAVDCDDLSDSDGDDVPVALPGGGIIEGVDLGIKPPPPAGPETTPESPSDPGTPTDSTPDPAGPTTLPVTGAGEWAAQIGISLLLLGLGALGLSRLELVPARRP